MNAVVRQRRALEQMEKDGVGRIGYAEGSDAAVAGPRVRFWASGRVLRRQIRRHPIARFLTEEDELFTDPDLEACGFRPSRH